MPVGLAIPAHPDYRPAPLPCRPTPGPCATCMTVPCTRGIFGAFFRPSAGADMDLTSDAAIVMPRGHMVFEGRAQIKAACSKPTLSHMGLPRPVSRLLPQTARCARPLRRPRDRRAAYAPTAGDG